MTGKRFASAVAVLLLLALLVALRLRIREAAAPPEPRASKGDSAPAPAVTEERQDVKVPGTTAHPAATPAGTAGLHISGRVLKFDGTPAGEVAISLSGVRATSHSKCDVEGRFRFENLGAQEFQLEVLGGVVTRRVDLQRGAGVDGLELRLPASRRISVSVADARGGAVPGVTVGLPYENLDTVAVTDARGTATLEGFSLLAVVAVMDLPTGLGHFLLPPEIELGEGDVEARFVLEDAGLASGVVRTPGGHPAENVWVAVFEGQREVSITRSGKDGAFEIPVPLGRTVSLGMSNDRSHRIPGPDPTAPSFWEDPNPFVQEPGSKESIRVSGRLDGVRAGDHDLVLQLVAVPERTLRLRVESPSGAPARAAVVKVHDGNGDAMLQQWKSGDLGEVTLRALPEIPLKVEVQPPNGRDAADWTPLVFYNIVPADQELVARFRKGFRLAGVVLGPDGEPCRGASVTTLIKRPGCGEIVVGADGRFSFLIDPEDPDILDLVAWAEVDGRSLEALVLRPDPKAGDVTIRLKVK